MTRQPMTSTAPAHRGWTLALAALGVFMTALDTLVVANALPALRVSLHADLGDLEWTVNAYNLAFAVALLTGAALGDRYGRKRVYWLGLLAFTAASAAAALSPGVGALIAARAMQGVAAAAIMPMTLTLISEAFPAEKRGAAIGLWGGITGLAVALGPVVGGAIVGGISWHWIFWLNVPIGLAVVPLSIARLTESFGPRAQLDVVGLLLAGAGFFGLTFGLVRAGSVGWGSVQTVLALAGGGALVGAFAGWERRTSRPMLAPRLFRSRGFNAANGVSFFMFASLFGVLFLMMQFLQNALGYSPLAAGLRTLPWTGAPMVVAPIAGALADRFGGKPFMLAGLALQAVGLGWIAAVAQPGMDYLPLAVPLGVAGVGISLCFPTVANAVVGSVPPSEIGIASGTNSAVRELGGVFGIAILAAVFVRPGVYSSPDLFVARFTDAVWLGAAFSAAGILAAALLPGRARGRSPVVVEDRTLAPGRTSRIMTAGVVGTLALSGRTVLVIGASRGLGRGIAHALDAAGAAVIALARSGPALADLATSGTSILAEVADAADELAAARLVERHRPDAIVVVAGAVPPLHPLPEQTWTTFSVNWQADVRIQRFLAHYAQDEADRAGLGITFTAVLPRITPLTAVGREAVTAYAERGGQTVEEYLGRFGELLTPDVAGAAMVDLIARPDPPRGDFLLAGTGLAALP